MENNKIIVSENKILVIDSSGIDPISFSLSEKHFSDQIIKNFFNNSGIESYYSNDCIREFIFEHKEQKDLLVESIGKTSLTNGGDNEIYLSNNGTFSSSSLGEYHCLPVYPLQSQQPIQIQEIDSSSSYYKHLSSEDKSILKVAKYKKAEGLCNNVAILVNDWNLKKQSIDCEAIPAFGTCSMLAGMVLNNAISYQKGTYIYKCWLARDPRWIPNDGNYKKLSFQKVLQIERERMNNKKSFWKPCGYR